MSVWRSGPRERWAALSGTDRVAAALWLTLALVLAGVAAVALARSSSQPVPPARGARVAPAAISRSASGVVLPGTLPAIRAATAASDVPAAGTPLTSPIAGAASVPNAAILPPGATLVQRVNLAGANGGPGTIVSYWQTTSADGCVQPRVTVLRPGSDGNWGAIWDSAASQGGEPPPIGTAARGGDRCFPAIGLFSVQPLDASGIPFVVLSLTAADGSQTVLAEALDDPANAQPAITEAAPGTQLSLSDGLPAVLEFSLPVYAPTAAGLAELQGQAIGREDALLSWQKGNFQPASRGVSANCQTGSVVATSASATGLAVAFHCPTGAYAAVALTPATQIAPGLLIGSLRPGDDISVTLLPPGPAAEPGALPVAAEVDSNAAAARPTAPPVVASPLPAAAQPAPAAPRTVAAPPAPAPQTRPAASAPSLPATLTAPDVVSPPARPIPLQPTVAATSRPIPQQSR